MTLVADNLSTFDSKFLQILFVLKFSMLENFSCGALENFILANLLSIKVCGALENFSCAVGSIQP